MLHQVWDAFSVPDDGERDLRQEDDISQPAPHVIPRTSAEVDIQDDESMKKISKECNNANKGYLQLKFLEIFLLTEQSLSLDILMCEINNQILFLCPRGNFSRRKYIIIML